MKRTKGNGTSPALPAIYEPLPAIIDRARSKLAEARTSAEVLEAREIADLALHLAKLRHAALDTYVACVLLISAAERRIGDEIIAGKERGELAPGHRPKKGSEAATLSDLGLTKDQSADYQAVARTPEKVIKDALQAEAAAGKEPTKATVKRAVKAHQADKEEAPKQSKSAHDRIDRWIMSGTEHNADAFLDYWISLDEDATYPVWRALRRIRAELGQVLQHIKDKGYRVCRPGT
jgi:hypothetical protein